jgi:hypothetical protein
MAKETKPKAAEAAPEIDHRQRLAAWQERMDALPVDAVRIPGMPVPVFVDEGHSAVAAAREHREVLEAAGMPAELPERLAEALAALASSQALWQAENVRGRSPELRELVVAAEALRADALAAGDLALRRNPEGLRRLSTIREGDGLPDLLADLTGLALLVGDARPHFESVKIDAPALAKTLEETAARLRSQLGREDAAKSLSRAKESRDRMYSLCVEALEDVRAFAAYAFRNDRGNQRRVPFLSAHARRRNHASRRRPADAPAPVPTT